MSRDTDKNFRSFGDNAEPIILTEVNIVPDDTTTYDDLFKLSHARNVRGYRVVVAHPRGRVLENPVDMNRECQDVVLESLHLEGGEHCSVVIKGGCERIVLRDVIITPHPKAKYDIELGGWSDQSQRKTRGVVLENVFRSDNKPVRVAVGNADKPTIIGGNVKIDKLWSLGLKLFIWFRRVTS